LKVSWISWFQRGLAERMRQAATRGEAVDG
jgi:hypothetical protein